ncbi:hypothetical protein [Lederbergia citrea]|uniref:Uncharacterized protein n=1 Tax=Lederbergia citrea TaxID=2833581 RepID=A0A942UQC9_9BACI|nr:hypothetical protein [Lederbergia citrea]MBS4178817.1 hypothetical protein [Lederbergia citrea]MBS4224167.1 hypothetical protein [Lederbergia citrea]
MSGSFQVKFRDGETLVISDIIEFEEKQQDEIEATAGDYTKIQLRQFNQDGKDLSYLTDEQKKIVLRTKKLTVDGKTADQLWGQKIVSVSVHSNERILERLGSDELSVIISIIDRIINTDFVIKAQFKGYPALTYTLMKSDDPEKFKFAVSFKRKNKGHYTLQIVTLTFKNSPHNKMTTRLIQDANLLNRMEDFKRKLKDAVNKEIKDNGNKN